MKKSVSKVLLKCAGVFFILIGSLLNQVILTNLFSEDGILEISTKLIIWIFDGFFIGLGLLLFISEFVRFLFLKLIHVFITFFRKPNTFRKLKNPIIYWIYCLLIYFSIKNIVASSIDYVAMNLTIRESFYFSNEVNKKGTHWGGGRFNTTFRENRDLLRFPYISNFKNLYSSIKNISSQTSNFKNEYNIIEILYKLSETTTLFKRETAIYIPKSLKVFWDISCDSHMPPFIVPAIANMAMIEGLPSLDKKSCYTHLLEYGFNRYYMLGKSAEFNSMTHEQICERARIEGFSRIIEINEDSTGKIITITHDCEING